MMGYGGIKKKSFLRSMGILGLSRSISISIYSIFWELFVAKLHWMFNIL